MKKAFTLIELIFVIVILAVISIFAAKILTKIYDEYLMTRAVNELQTKTELTLNKLAALLQYRIKPTVIARRLPPNDTNITALQNADDNYEILEWISYDFEGFRGGFDSTKNIYTPGWSGFVDLDSAETNATSIKTPGSSLSVADAIISQLSGGNASLTLGNVGLIFKGIPAGFNVVNYGWNDYSGAINNSYVENVSCPAPCTDRLILTEPVPAGGRNVSEQYYLAWTAYAVVPQAGTNGLSNLLLFYNYRPWAGESYQDTQTLSALLCEGVSVFKFKQVDRVIRLKLCLTKTVTPDYNITFCKEKAVY